jgi:hypothetical protein
MKFTRERRALLVNSVPQLLILQKRLLGKDAQLFACFGEGYRAVIAYKQRLTEVFFQALDLTRKRRGTDVHCSRATAKVATFGQMKEHFQIA